MDQDDVKYSEKLIGEKGRKRERERNYCMRQKDRITFIDKFSFQREKERKRVRVSERKNSKGLKEQIF